MICPANVIPVWTDMTSRTQRSNVHVIDVKRPGPTWNVYSEHDGPSPLWGLLLPLALIVQMVLLNQALVNAAVLLVTSLNMQEEAALGGSGETKTLLQASETLSLWVTEQACVIKLHQSILVRRNLPGVQPRNLVEKGRIESTRDDVTLERYFVSLLGSQRPLCLIQLKVISCRRRVKKDLVHHFLNINSSAIDFKKECY